MNMQFQYIEAFALLLLVLLFLFLFWRYRIWKTKTSRKIGDEALVKAMFRDFSPKKQRLKFILVLAAFVLGVTAISNPRRPDMASGEERKGIDVFFGLDVSNSMLATDVPPVRLQKAKDLVTTLIDQMQDDRIGLILFAGRAYLQMPLSTDHQAAKLFVSNAGPNAVPEPGTAIADVLKKADEAFDKSNRFKTIILITDGETHDEGAAEALKELVQKGIMVNTVGIGSAEGSTIIDPETNAAKRDDAGNIVVSKLNQQLLTDVATQTNGTYVHLDDVASTAGRIMTQYQNVEKKALPDFTSMTFQSFYWWFALPMLLLLMAEIFISDKKKDPS